MPTVRFIQRDFIDAFFSPIPKLEIYDTEAWDSDNSNTSDKAWDSDNSNISDEDWEESSIAGTDTISYRYETGEDSSFDDSDAIS
jgi:hypothetical protein